MADNDRIESLGVQLSKALWQRMEMILEARASVGLIIANLPNDKDGIETPQKLALGGVYRQLDLLMDECTPSSVFHEIGLNDASAVPQPEYFQRELGQGVARG